MKDRFGRLALSLAIFCAPLVIHADEPSPRVARVSYTGGDVSYERGDSDGWNALGINTPLVTGDSLYTADDGRAEVHLGSGNVLRMDSGTQVDLLSNTRDLAQIGLRSGYLSLRARSVSESGSVEIDTPSGAATILEPGLYRVELSDGGARYSVVKGQLSVSVSGQQLDVDAGESLAIEGTDEPRYYFDPIAPETAFDQWARERDVRTERSRSVRYVHRDVVGYEDLDDHGTWRDTPDYGRVWTPSGMPYGWAPYQAGSWTWQDPYGWTWVSNEPWGWAPYHYGRWIFVRGAWGWVPPPPVGFHGPSFVAEIRPTYAPALVAFVGGNHWSVGISLGGGPSIGWVPLAPRERYYYPWQPAPRVTNNYTNITVINAVTVVNTTNFARGPIRPIRVPPGQLRHAPIVGYTATSVVPTHDSLCPSHPRDPHSRFVPRIVDNRPLVVRTQPPSRPVPFDEKIAVIQKTGRPFDAHDRGEHSGWDKHASRNDRIATVSALAPEGRKELMPRPGAVAKPPHRIDQHVDMTPRPERAQPKDGGEIATRPEQVRERPESRPSAWPARPEPAKRSATAPPVQPPGDGADRNARNQERHMPSSEQPDSQPTAAPRAPARTEVVSAPDRSHARPAAKMHEAHVAPPMPPSPRPETATRVAQVSQATPQHDGLKPDTPKAKDAKAKDAKAKDVKAKDAKAKDDKGNGKDKPADNGQQKDR